MTTKTGTYNTQSALRKAEAKVYEDGKTRYVSTTSNGVLVSLDPPAPGLQHFRIDIKNGRVFFPFRFSDHIKKLR